MRLVAIDPKNPDRLVVTVDRYNEDDSIFVSDDQGATFTEYLTITQVGGVTFAPDGRIWIGDTGDTLQPSRPSGLWAAASLDEQAEKIADYVVQCLTYEPTSKTLLRVPALVARHGRSRGRHVHLDFQADRSQIVLELPRSRHADGVPDAIVRRILR